MKKLFFSLMATVFFSLIGVAQTSEKKEPWPYGCRTHTISIEISPFGYSTEITLCCVAALWKTPPIKCWEVNKKDSNSNIYYQYFMVKDIEKQLNLVINEKTIIVSSKNNLIEDGSNFSLIKKEYLIETNELNEKFVKLEFVKIK